jgi:hypothetical protein
MAVAGGGGGAAGLQLDPREVARPEQAEGVRADVARAPDHAAGGQSLKVAQTEDEAEREDSLVPHGKMFPESVVMEEAGAKALIQSIRDGFYADSTDPAVINLQENVAQACERLAGDLYSSSTHFAMELIQNAEDNYYADQTDPMLMIEFSDSAIVVRSNELGFTEENVRAIVCSHRCSAFFPHLLLSIHCSRRTASQNFSSRCAVPHWQVFEEESNGIHWPKGHWLQVRIHCDRCASHLLRPVPLQVRQEREPARIRVTDVARSQALAVRKHMP